MIFTKGRVILTKEYEKSRPVLPDGCGGSSATLTNVSSSDCSRILAELQDEVSSKFVSKKEDTFLLSDVYSSLGFDSRSCRVSDCGTFLEYYVTESEKKLHAANFCRDRLCPMCNWRRSKKIFSQMSRIMDYLEKDGYRFLFLTLTVKNCSVENLRLTIDNLFSGWRYLYHKNRVFRTVVCGTYRGLEVTRNKETGEFHPHFHVILAVRPDYFTRSYVTQEHWSNLWRSACDLAYDPIVHIETVKSGSRGLSGAVSEAAKYAVKSSDYLIGSMDDRLSYVSAFLSSLTNRKLVSLTGCFRKAGKLLSLDDMENGDLVHVDNDDFREDLAYMIVRYGWRNGLYVRF